MIFVAKNIRTERVNLLMNNLVAGLPSPLSFIGLADAIVRDLDMTPWSARVIPVLHHVSASAGRTKPEMENKSGVFMPIETMEDMIGSVELSLILDMPECDSETDITSSLMRRRIAGGNIQNHDEIEVQHVTEDGSAFRELRRGYAMLPPDKAENCITGNGEGNTFESILNTLFPNERQPGSGWMIPVAAGYWLLEDPETAPERSCRRDPTLPHVFAEPLLGLAELVSIRNKRLTELTQEDFQSLFWSWQARGDLILGHPAYLSNANHKENISHG